jgi:phosphoglycolate phosphatase-like HAD superfamily hydrolase
VHQDPSPRVRRVAGCQYGGEPIEDLRRLIGDAQQVGEAQALGLTLLELAGIADRFDVIISGSHAEERIGRALNELGVDPDRAVAVGVEADELRAARTAGVALGIARGSSSPEQLRRAGADAVVADLQELLHAV